MALPKRNLLWFTNDLRIHDNEVLIQAMATAEEIIPVYCLDEQLFSFNHFGLKNIGKHRLQYLLESLHNLHLNLKKLGSDLLFIKGNPLVEIPKLVQQYHIQGVYKKKENAINEILLEHQLQKELNLLNCKLKTFESSSLYHSTDLPFSVQALPDVFTKFRTSIENKTQIREIRETPVKIQSPKLPSQYLPTLEELGFAKEEKDKRATFDLEGGETAALQHLHDYIHESKAISHYKITRNELMGKYNSSKLSIPLAHGCLSPKKIYQEIKLFEQAHGGNESTYWLYFELLWRDYFAFAMAKYPKQFFLQKGIQKTNNKLAKHDPKKFSNWVNGQTADELINALMNELKQTGYMSNRGRQIVASYFCHNLQLDWRYGSAYFEQELIDYDVSSNWCNWAYIAGVGNNPRGASIFNTSKQAAEYDPNHQYRNLWLNPNQNSNT